MFSRKVSDHVVPVIIYPGTTWTLTSPGATGPMSTGLTSFRPTVLVISGRRSRRPERGHLYGAAMRERVEVRTDDLEFPGKEVERAYGDCQ